MIICPGERTKKQWPTVVLTYFGKARIHNVAAFILGSSLLISSNLRWPVTAFCNWPPIRLGAAFTLSAQFPLTSDRSLKQSRFNESNFADLIVSFACFQCSGYSLSHSANLHGHSLWIQKIWRSCVLCERMHWLVWVLSVYTGSLENGGIRPKWN